MRSQAATVRPSPRKLRAIAAGTNVLAVLALAVSWAAWEPAWNSVDTRTTLVVALSLIAATVAAHRFPIELSRRTKVYISSVPHYLLAVLLAPPIAAVASGGAVLLGDLSVRKRTGNPVSVIATQSGRRVLVVLTGAVIAHLGGSSVLHALALVVAALVLGGGDIVTSPLVLEPITGMPPIEIVLAVARQAYIVEGVQYLLGLLGALAVMQQYWALVLLAPPTVLVYLAWRASMRAQEAQEIAEEACARAEATQKALTYQALHDMLTGLPNRTLLNDRVQQALHIARRDDTPLALLLLDLDRFKEINDTFGHDYGDVLLQRVAERLRGTLRASDAVARLGGDEFAILLPEDDAEGAVSVACKITETLDRPFLVDGHLLHVEGSIGIALYPQHGADAATLLRHADVAMYAAKRCHGRHAVYNPLHDQLSPTRHAVITALRQAIERDQLVLHYQPIVDLSGNRPVSVEALVRWSHPDDGLLSPEKFISLAEHTGLIVPLSRWVLEAALRQRQVWQQGGLDVTVTVNLSMPNLQDQQLVDMIRELLRRYDTPPAALRIEITESALMDDPAPTHQVLTRLNELGVHISVDDFGTGYSSLAYLKNLPVDELKIDQSFILHMVRNETDAVIVRSTIGLAHGLGLRVVGEGVEDRQTCEMLSTLGCDAIQGYYVSAPLPASDLEGWLRGSRRRAGAIARASRGARLIRTVGSASSSLDL